MKNVQYYKDNCEEDYLHTPISVLRYIGELEKQLETKPLNIASVDCQRGQYCECEKPILGDSVWKCGTCGIAFKPII